MREGKEGLEGELRKLENKIEGRKMRGRKQVTHSRGANYVTLTSGDCEAHRADTDTASGVGKQDLPRR